MPFVWREVYTTPSAQKPFGHCPLLVGKEVGSAGVVVGSWSLSLQIPFGAHTNCAGQITGSLLLGWSGSNGDRSGRAGLRIRRTWWLATTSTLSTLKYCNQNKGKKREAHDEEISIEKVPGRPWSIWGTAHRHGL
jgi:hypothetical protein